MRQKPPETGQIQTKTNKNSSLLAWSKKHQKKFAEKRASALKSDRVNAEGAERSSGRFWAGLDLGGRPGSGRAAINRDGTPALMAYSG